MVDIGSRPGCGAVQKLTVRCMYARHKHHLQLPVLDSVT